MILDFFVYAYNNLRRRGIRSFLTVLGIFIGIVAVVALISLGQGMQNAINQEFETIGKDRIIITGGGMFMGPTGSSLSVAELTGDDVDVVEKVRGIEYVVGVLSRQVKVEFRDEVKYISLFATPTDSESMQYIEEISFFEIEKGRQHKSTDQYKVILGYDVAHEFFDDEIKIGDKIEIDEKQFTVIGIQKKAGTVVHDMIIRIPLDVARDIFDEPEKVSTIFAKVKTGQDVNKVADDIKEELRDFRDVEEDKEDFSVETSEQVIANLNVILNVVQAVLVGIAAISLLVGGVGIANTMYTSVLERTREIGIMKAVGARNSDITLIFLIESGLLGLIGGVIGIVIGLGISKGVEAVAAVSGVSMLKASFSPVLIIGALAFSFIVGSISGLMPARRAAKLKPVEALRYE